METITLYHTSADPITKINMFGVFGDCLCFASEPYFMTQAANPVTYSINLNKGDVVEASGFFYRDDYQKLDSIVEEIMQSVECDRDTAEDLLSGSVSLSDVADEFDMELDFYIQKLQGEAGKVLGYRATEVRDEQGAMWLVSMLDRENELTLAGEER